MPVNPGIEYQLAEEEYRQAHTVAEKIRCLEKMYATVPKHKSSESLVREIKTKLSKFRSQVEKARTQKKKGHSFFIKKEGAAQVFVIGVANSGKSTLLCDFTHASPDVAAYPFTTTKPEVGVLDYHGVKIQLVEIPAFFPGYNDKEMGPSYMGMVRNADAVIIVLDCSREIGVQLHLIEDICLQNFIKLGSVKSVSRSFVHIPALIVKTKSNRKVRSSLISVKPELFPSSLWKLLGLMYVYTKTPSGDTQYPPVALKKGATVRDLAEKVHKDFVHRLKYARIWGKSVKYGGATAGLDHILVEEDVVELHIR